MVSANRVSNLPRKAGYLIALLSCMSRLNDLTPARHIRLPPLANTAIMPRAFV